MASYSSGPGATAGSSKWAPCDDGPINTSSSVPLPIKSAAEGEKNVESLPPDIFGCTNPLASNYNPKATINDGSCIIKRKSKSKRY